MTFYARSTKQNGACIPHEPLIEHLQGVAELARKNLQPPSLPNVIRLSELAFLCGLTHDFGKYTNFFQRKLQCQDIPKQAYGNHAFISALLVAFVAKERYKESLEAALLTFLAIHRHHGELISPSDLLPQARHLKDAPKFKIIEGEVYRVDAEQLRAIHTQIKDIEQSSSRQQILDEMSALGIIEVQDFLQSQWWALLSELRSFYKDKIEDKEEASFYWKTTLLFSALIDADKYISAAASERREFAQITRVNKINPQIVDDHIHSLKNPNLSTLPPTQQRLYEIRNSVYQEATAAIQSKPLSELYPSVLSLTAPTGSGKTLTALGCAFRLRERLQQEKGFAPRIIYALPFVNIIDQNFEVTKQVLSRLEDFKANESNYLLKHHHLAPLAFKEDESRSNDEALLLTESWESEVIVTTFVQLLESLITNRNRALKKLHNIAGSIVILDEVQSIPYEQWRLVEHVLTTLTQCLGCTVLQMTATRPRMLTSAKELLEKPEKHFEGLARTILTPQQEITSIEELANFTIGQKTPEKSVLVVLNTIRSAVELYDKLKSDELSQEERFIPYREDKSLKCSDKPLIVYLSTNITPWQRKRRVRMLRRYMKLGIKPIVISTQVIEAGVDLDFDVVIRDQGPLDSIIQVAGRCNRNASNDAREVYIIYLKRDDGSEDAQLVYGKILPDISRKIFNGLTLEERAIYNKLETYYGEFPSRLSKQFSSDFIASINELRFHSKDEKSHPVSAYRLIDDIEQEPIFVEVNQKAIEVRERLEVSLEKLKTLDFHSQDYSDLRFDIRDLWRKLGQFVVKATRYRLKQNPPCEKIFEDYYYIRYSEVIAESYYSIETGFIWNPQTLIF